MRIRLSDADRERFGVPEFLPVTLGTITNREAVALQKLGYPTPPALARALEAGANDGDIDFQAVTALVWLSLCRVGVQVDFYDLEFDVWQLQVVPDEEPPAPAGPESGKATGRAGSTSSRRPRSTSGATSKGRSTPTGSRS